MSNNIDVTITADSKSAEQALEKMNTKLQKTEQKLEKMRQVSQMASQFGKKGFDDQSNSIDRFAVKVTTAITSLLSMQSAVRLIGQEWEKVAQSQDRARLASIDPAIALRSAIFAMEDDETVTGKTLESKLLEISKKNNADFAIVARVFEQASSSKGSGTNQDVLNAMDAAFAKGVTDEFEAATLAKRSLNLSKFSGTKDMNVNMGIIQELGSASMVKDFQFIGENLVPAVIGLTKLGNTVEQAEELVSATTHLITDDTGDVSARAIQLLGQQIMSFHLDPEQKGKHRGQIVSKDNEGEFVVPAEQFAAFDAEKSMPERMRMLREMPELQRAFLSRLAPGSLHLPTKAEESLRGLIRGDDREMTELKKVQDVIVGPSSPQSRAMLSQKFQKKIATMDATEMNQALEAELAQKSATQQGGMEDVPGRRISEARATFRETLANIDMPGIDWAGTLMPRIAFEQATKFISNEGGTPEFAAANILKTIATKASSLEQDDMTPEDVKELQDAIKRLEERGRSLGRLMPDWQRAAVEATQRNFDATGTPSGFMGPVVPGVTQQFSRDPQMEENNKLLKKIADGVSTSSVPRQTERPASRLSRGNR